MVLQQSLVSTTLWSLSAIGLPRLLSSRFSGAGGILAFHRIYQPQPHEFGSLRISVTPCNFRRVVQTLKERGYRFLSMSGLADWLINGESSGGKVICLTFDDGFADTYTSAFPVCREFGVPMTVYLVSGFIQRQFPMWSFGLETAIAKNDRLTIRLADEPLTLNCRTMREKAAAFRSLASRLVVAAPDDVREVCQSIGSRYQVDFMTPTNRNVLTVSMIREMRDSGLVDFGAHSVHHVRLGSLEHEVALWEIEQSKRDCEELVDSEVRHFAYPYGDAAAAGPREVAMCAQLGFRTAVTTECNTLFGTDARRLLNLPRLTYSGSFQDTPLLDLLLSGTLPKLRRHWQAFRPLACASASMASAKPAYPDFGHRRRPHQRTR